MTVVTRIQSAEAICRTSGVRHAGKLTSYSDGSMGFDSERLTGDCQREGPLIMMGDYVVWANNPECEWCEFGFPRNADGTHEYHDYNDSDAWQSSARCGSEF